MNLNEVESVVDRLEKSYSGKATALPGNADIVSAFAFMRKHLHADDDLIRGLANRLESPQLRIDDDLVRGMRALRTRLTERMQCDAQLSSRVNYVANHIPRDERISNTVFALVIFVYGAVSLLIDDFYIPGKRSNGEHLHGMPVWIMFAASLCAVIVLTATVIDHYDKRPNERGYQRLGKAFRVLGWGLFLSAFAADFASKFSH